MNVKVRNRRGRIHSPSRLICDHQTVTPLRSGTTASGRVLRSGVRVECGTVIIWNVKLRNEGWDDQKRASPGLLLWHVHCAERTNSSGGFDVPPVDIATNPVQFCSAFTSR